MIISQITSTLLALLFAQSAFAAVAGGNLYKNCVTAILDPIEPARPTCHNGSGKKTVSYKEITVKASTSTVPHLYKCLVHDRCTVFIQRAGKIPAKKTVLPPCKGKPTKKIETFIPYRPRYEKYCLKGKPGRVVAAAVTVKAGYERGSNGVTTYLRPVTFPRYTRTLPACDGPSPRKRDETLNEEVNIEEEREDYEVDAQDIDEHHSENYSDETEVSGDESEETEEIL